MGEEELVGKIGGEESRVVRVDGDEETAIEVAAEGVGGKRGADAGAYVGSGIELNPGPPDFQVLE